MKKNLVLDTNILLEEGSALTKLGKDNIHIPFVVLQEVDKYKSEQSKRGYNAREFIRSLELLREATEVRNKTLADGVKMADGGILRVAPEEHLDLTPDDQIIMVAADLVEQNKKGVLLLSNDVNVRVKANLRKVKSSGYDPNETAKSLDELYSGITDLVVPSDVIDEMYSEGEVEFEDKGSLFPNQFLLMKDECDFDHTGIGRIREDGFIEPLAKHKSIFGIAPKNLEQGCALDLLMDPELPLVTVMGRAGEGKPLLALAAALEQVIEKKEYSKVIIIRPLVSLGDGVGYLPGDLNEKIAPWTGAVADNFDVLFDENGDDRMQEMVDRGQIEFAPPTFIRGRSIQNAIVIVDEAQNLTQHEMKTIITRMHETSKVVVTGDIFQIDTPKLSSTANGFTYLVNCFREYGVAGHITLQQCERGSLAALAGEIM